MIYHHFEVGMSRVASMRGRLFNEQGSSLAVENGAGLGGMSVDAWDVYKSNGPNGQKGRLTFDELYNQAYIHEEYPVELVIQKKLLLNDQYGRIQDTIRRAGISGEQKMEIDAAGLLNLAFDSATTWSDGVPLCSASHPVGKHAGSAVYSNRGTSALTPTAIKTTRVTMMRFKDDKSNEIGTMPNELWVPPELEEEAWKATKSRMESDSANNADNPKAAQSWTIIPWLRLTDPKNWFMVDGMWRQEVAKWYNREATQIMLVAENTTELVYEFKLHYSFGVDDWRWIYGNEVA